MIASFLPIQNGEIDNEFYYLAKKIYFSSFYNKTELRMININQYFIKKKSR